jgi:4-amino-4-deoxychorismate lyase
MSTSQILINGEPSDGTVPVTDSSVLRGDGCFEVIRAYGGSPFRLQEHLDRLASSAAMLDIPLPPLEDVAKWVNESAETLPGSAVRVVVTRGSSVPGVEGGPLVIVFAHEWAGSGQPARLLPVRAPWHAAGEPWELAGAKVISYGPNMAATRTAQKAGYDDALLTTIDDLILEGPTFSVAWVVDDVIETPGLEMGILDSITRRVFLEVAADLGLEVVEVKLGLDRLAAASEVIAMSTIREFQPVGAVGDREWAYGPVTRSLVSAFRRLAGD